jgi:hypothetical protein
MKWKETAMRRIALVAVLLSGFFLITGQPAMATHITATYRVAPESSSGPTGMTVCLRFSGSSIPGNLEVVVSTPDGPLIRVLTWEHQDLGTDLHRFMAVTMEDDPSLPDFMIFGKFKAAPPNLRTTGFISGEYLDELGLTLNFTGEKVKSCTPGP